MGHGLGISDSYFKPTEKEILTEYLKVVERPMGAHNPPTNIQDILFSYSIFLCQTWLRNILHEFAIRTERHRP
jgi:hypothetical protein